MGNDKDYTTIRVSKYSHKFLKRYAKTHFLSLRAFLDNLTSLILCGCPNLENNELTDRDLQEIYRYSSLMIVADMRKFNSPTKGE